MKTQYAIPALNASVTRRPGRGGTGPANARQDRKDAIAQQVANDPTLSGWQAAGLTNEKQRIYEYKPGGELLMVACKDGTQGGQPVWYFENTIGEYVSLVGPFPTCSQAILDGRVQMFNDSPIPFMGEPVYVDGDLADITIDF